MAQHNPNQPPQNPGQIQPGWYPDPASGQMRWWDGRYWGPFHGPLPTNPRSTAALAHYLGILGLLGPLIIMLTNSSNDPFVRDQSVEALNFHLTFLIAWFVAMFVGFLSCGVGMALFPLLFIGEVVLAITAGQAASRGEWYRYPVSIRMVSSGLEGR